MTNLKLAMEAAWGGVADGGDADDEEQDAAPIIEEQACGGVPAAAGKADASPKAEQADASPKPGKADASPKAGKADASPKPEKDKSDASPRAEKNKSGASPRAGKNDWASQSPRVVSGWGGISPKVEEDEWITPPLTPIASSVDRGRSFLLAGHLGNQDEVGPRGMYVRRQDERRSISLGRGFRPCHAYRNTIFAGDYDEEGDDREKLEILEQAVRSGGRDDSHIGRCGKCGSRCTSCNKSLPKARASIPRKDVKPKSFSRLPFIPPKLTADEKEIFGSNTARSLNFDKFDSIAVKVTGENAPNQIHSFESAGLGDILENIKKSGYNTPTPIQKRAIPIIMAGKDMLGCSQTGSGKTASYLLPIIQNLLNTHDEIVVENGCAQPQALIIAPTRDLTKQIYDEARKFSYKTAVKVAAIYDGRDVLYQEGVMRDGCQLLVATPDRLNSFVERKRVSFECIKYIIMDEMDCMLDMGFRPTLKTLIDGNLSMVDKEDRCTVLFSATFPRTLLLLASEYLKTDYLLVTVCDVGCATTDVEQFFVEIGRKEKMHTLLKYMQENEHKRILVIVETRRNTDFLASYLSVHYKPTAAIHANKSEQDCNMAVQLFNSGARNILVATGVAERGLDIQNLDAVFNYDLPKTIDEYNERISRVRNGGRAISLFDTKEDMSLVPGLTKIMWQIGQPVPDFLYDYACYMGGPYAPRFVRDDDDY